MRVFVLSPGRSGSLTFISACQHMTNFSAGHESRSELVVDRFSYPDDHIEADNRLTWMLGGLAKAARADDRYVWLRRDESSVVESFLRRWDSTYRASIVRAFAYGIVQRRAEWDEADRESVIRFYVRTVEANIEEFLQMRSHMVVRLGSGDFEIFWDWVGAEGDRKAAALSWAKVHNSSRGESQ